MIEEKTLCGERIISYSVGRALVIDKGGLIAVLSLCSYSTFCAKLSAFKRSLGTRTVCDCAAV